MRSILAVLACAVLMAAAVAGCGRKQTVTTPEGTTTVTEKGDKTTVTFEGEGGEGTFEMKGDKAGGTITTDKGTLEYGSEVKVSEKEVGIPFYPGAKAAHTGKLMQTGRSRGSSSRSSSPPRIPWTRSRPSTRRSSPGRSPRWRLPPRTAGWCR